MKLLRFTIVFLAIAMFGSTAIAGLEIEYIGAIRDGLLAPTSVVASSDQIAVLEPFSQRLTLLTADGRLSHSVDLAGDAIGLVRSGGTRYLFCDRTQKSIIGVEPGTERQFEFFRDQTSGSDPIDIVADGESIYVLDAGRAEIIVLTVGGQLSERIALPDEASPDATHPVSFAFDPIRQLFYVGNQVSSRIQVVDRRGTLVTAFGSFGGGDGSITRVGGIACDRKGQVYVADRYQGRIAVFTAEGEFLGNVEPHSIGAPRLAVPMGITIDESDLLYVASAEGRSVEIYHVAGRDDPQTPLIATPVYPADFDTVDATDLQLVANAEVPTAAAGAVQVDFQMFNVSDMDAPVAEIYGVTADLPQGRDSITTVLTAEWRPSVELPAGTTFGWRVRTHAAGGVSDWSTTRWFVTRAGLLDYHLAQNYPNPFNPSTNVSFTLQKGTAATFAVYNLLGQQMWTQTWDHLPAGQHLVTWNGRDQQGNRAASGVYFYRLTAGNFSQTRKMVLLR